MLGLGLPIAIMGTYFLLVTNNQSPEYRQVYYDHNGSSCCPEQKRLRLGKSTRGRLNDCEIEIKISNKQELSVRMIMLTSVNVISGLFI